MALTLCLPPAFLLPCLVCSVFGDFGANVVFLSDYRSATGPLEAPIAPDAWVLWSYDRGGMGMGSNS